MSAPRMGVGTVLAWIALLTFVLTLLSGVAIVSGIGFGFGYYTAGAARLEHPLHEWLRPGGPVGVLMGVVGTSLMLVMLTYTLRKLGGQYLWFLGPVAWWLRFHIVCGIFGPIYILVHSAYHLPTGLVATAFWCMMAVAGSGVFGRYVYGHFPKSAAGKELSLADARAELKSLRTRLVEETADADAERIAEAVALVSDLDQEVHTLSGWLMLHLDVHRRIDLVDVQLRRAGLTGAALRDANGTLAGQLKLKRNLEALRVSKRLFRWWHLFHNPLARAMYLIASLHVLEAVLFGGALSQLARFVP